MTSNPVSLVQLLQLTGSSWANFRLAKSDVPRLTRSLALVDIASDTQDTPITPTHKKVKHTPTVGARGEGLESRLDTKSPRLEFYSEGCVFDRLYQENWLEHVDLSIDFQSLIIHVYTYSIEVQHIC